MPSALWSAVAAPVARVAAVARWLTSSVRPPPPRVKVPPLATSALLVIKEIAIARTGVMASPPAPVVLAPSWGKVYFVAPPWATRLKPVAPLRTTFGLTRAWVLSTTMASAIERPRPHALPVAPLADRALVTESDEDVALSEAAPVSVIVEPSPIEASLLDRTSTKAKEPATEFLPPPAPEVASAL